MWTVIARSGQGWALHRSAPAVTPLSRAARAAARRLRLAAALGAAISGYSAGAWAGDVQINLAQGRNQLVVEATDAGPGEILAALAARFDFVLEGAITADASSRGPVRLQGSLDAALERLLKRENYIIERSAERRGGIARLLILGPKGNIEQVASSGEAPNRGAEPAPTRESATAIAQALVEPPAQAKPKVSPDSKVSKPSAAEIQALAQLESTGSREAAVQLLMMNGTPMNVPSFGTGDMPSPEAIVGLLQLAETKVRALSGQIERLPRGGR